jgi:hypothetical protein
VLGIGNRKCDKRADIRAGGSQRAPPLIGPTVQFSEGHRVCGAIARDDGQSCVVTTLFGELLKFGPERNFFGGWIGSDPRSG